MDNPIYRYPLEKVLEALGARKGAVKDFWYSPLRDEKEASLHVNREKNVWHDFGANVGGTNVSLVQLVLHCSKAEAEAYIAKMDPVLELEQKEASAPAQPAQEIKRIRDVSTSYLTNYIEGRKIPAELAREYCKELLVYSPAQERNYTWLGFPNNSGGWAMAHPNGYKRTTNADITTINMDGRVSTKPSSGKVAVFEGFWDFLSWQVMQGSLRPTCDIVVLNSVNNIEKARSYITQHDRVGAFLDRDEAGRRCHDRVCEMMGRKSGEVLDMSHLYKDHNDLNEFLQASRGYTANMRLTPTM